MAAEGKLIQWRWDLGTVGLDLKIIWEMSIIRSWTGAGAAAGERCRMLAAEHTLRKALISHELR